VTFPHAGRGDSDHTGLSTFTVNLHQGYDHRVLSRCWCLAVLLVVVGACTGSASSTTAAPSTSTTPTITSSTTLQLPTTTTTTSTEHPPLSSVPPARECAGASGDPVDLTDEPPLVREFVWTDARGCVVRVDVVHEYAGSAHCGRQTTRVLRTGDPVGVRWDYPWPSGDGVEYVRDPDQAFGQPELTAGFSAIEALPADGIDTGLRSLGRELWVSPSDPDAVYIRDFDGVERWPRGAVPGCM